ncbi:hypothetical protein DXT63_14720 [Thermoanaerobacteraceae bacterium SP2]|nr:hypothetical protein DXT63_14720 [Thermoanaerobacteraceae bacterium SP2]
MDRGMYNVLFFNYFENNSQKFVIGYARKGLMLLTNLDIKDGKDCLRPILCYIEYDGLGREFYCHFFVCLNFVIVQVIYGYSKSIIYHADYYGLVI